MVFPAYIDDYSQTTKIIIDTENGQAINFYYKLRDSFHFKVGGGLTIRNLIWDAADSSYKAFGANSNFDSTYSVQTTKCYLNVTNNAYTMAGSDPDCYQDTW